MNAGGVVFSVRFRPTSCLISVEFESLCRGDYPVAGRHQATVRGTGAREETGDSQRLDGKVVLVNRWAGVVGSHQIIKSVCVLERRRDNRNVATSPAMDRGGGGGVEIRIMLFTLIRFFLL